MMTFQLMTYLTLTVQVSLGSEAANRLYDDLIYQYDNKMVLPVAKPGDNVTVLFGSSLIRLIDVDEKNQVFTANLWLDIRWTDHRISWNPVDYSNITKLHIPIEKLWKPDIVLYNNAAGQPEISIFTDAFIYFDGTIVWKPPAIFKSFCAIDVTYFPYDEQHCMMKFGMWSYTGDYVDMRQVPVAKKIIMVPDEKGKITEFQEIGMDLSYFYPSDEWELMNLTSRRYAQEYNTCCGPAMYIDIRYYFRLQRKPLFYTVNLIAPCVMIAFLTTFVFYLPSHSMKKLTFSVSILVTLTVFFLVLIEMIPPTSLVIPLFGKYLLFTLIMVSVSIAVSVVTVRLHFRQRCQQMPGFVRWLFIEKLPRLLKLQPLRLENDERILSELAIRKMEERLAAHKMAAPVSYQSRSISPRTIPVNRETLEMSVHEAMVGRVIENINFIANYFKRQAQEQQFSIEWMFVAVVIDRLFLFIFTVANCLGTVFIILIAPSLYDKSLPIAIPNPTNPLSGDTLTSEKWNYFEFLYPNFTALSQEGYSDSFDDW